MADSWSPESSARCTPASRSTRASTSAPLADSRMAEVQKEIMSSARCSSAKATASRMKSTSSCWPSSVMAPSASWYRISGRDRLCSAYADGRAPGWASTRSR